MFFHQVTVERLSRFKILSTQFAAEFVELRPLAVADEVDWFGLFPFRHFLRRLRNVSVFEMLQENRCARVFRVLRRLLDAAFLLNAQATVEVKLVHRRSLEVLEGAKIVPGEAFAGRLEAVDAILRIVLLDPGECTVLMLEPVVDMQAAGIETLAADFADHQLWQRMRN